MKTFALVTLSTIALFATQAYAKDDVKLSKSVMTEEIVYQVLNVVDIGQTLDIKHHKNLEEGDFMKSGGSAEAIGHHPSDLKVVGFLALNGFAHYTVTRYMVNHNAPNWVVHSWEAVSIGAKFNCIQKNYSLGLKINF